MNSTIFYFSGIGNSLAIARKLGERLGESRIISMPSALEEGIRPTGERIGLVFPTYAFGLPRMVREFVSRVTMPGGAYIFAVASSFGIPGDVLKQLGRLLEKSGSALDAGFCTADPKSSLMSDPDKDGIQKLMIGLNQGRRPEESYLRIDEIAAAAASKAKRPLEGSGRLAGFAGGILNSLASASFKTMASKFYSAGNCSGCGTCVSVCPRNNIRIEGGRPAWGEDCEMCHACIHWCPREAVELGDLTVGRERYRNPEITLRDMVLRRAPGMETNG
jgi:ferredoxin